MYLFYCFLFILTSLPDLEAQRFCAGSNESYILSGDSSQYNISIYQKKQTQCSSGVNFCYSLWKEVTGPDNTTNIKIITQGCWEMSGTNNCLSEECLSRPTHSNSLFCCCSAQLCNLNISKADPELLSTTSTPDELVSEKQEGGSNNSYGVILSFWAGVVLVAIPVILLLSKIYKLRHKKFNCNNELVSEKQEGGSNNSYGVILSFWAGVVLVAIPVILFSSLKRWSPLMDKKLSQKSGERGEGGGGGPRDPRTPLYSMSTIQLSRIVGEGRYGTVWLASAKEEQIAVKMFPQHYSQYFYNEQDIYSLPFMEHPSLLTYFGSDECKDKDGVLKLGLFLSYCPLGSLQELLKSRPLPLSTFCSLAVSTAAGLAHLHTEVHMQGKWKPCITHRDINTRNILVKEDMTCCICDLGLAVKITGPHYYALGEEMHAETKSINDVGTLRYMAPEVLEGAVNLRDCETSLKQIDVYALGLVLWEMAIRVTDFYQRPADVLPYMLPFEKEVGLHPSLEEMQTTVCRNKARVMFPTEWKWSRAARCIRETVEDCTDQDGEARLTALCVQERLAHIYRSTIDGGGLSPTSNQINSHFNITFLNYNNNHITNHFNQHHLDLEHTGDRDKTDCSEGTVETLLTHSPSESSPHLTLITECLQPYQGRNPCMERNLLCDSSEEVCVIETSAKDPRSSESQALISQPAPPAAVPLRVVPRPPPPVPYHQNSPFQPQKQAKTNNEDQRSNERGGGAVGVHQVVPRYSVPLKKLAGGGSGGGSGGGPGSTGAAHQGVLTVSPWEPSLRPTSLTLFSSDGDSEVEEERLRELSSRIGTPGDLPPAVRKKRGERAARLSLYDDRIMTNNSTF